MTNLNAAFFTNLNQQSIVDKQKAELYMQLYPYIAEDFLSSKDATVYGDVMKLHIMNLQSQLTRLFEILSTHTHVIPPHVHQGAHGTTSPQLGPLISQVPIQKPTIVWSMRETPIPINTTGAVWNLAGNFVVPGLPSDGMAITSNRRSLPLPLTLSVVLPPILAASVGI